MHCVCIAALAFPNDGQSEFNRDMSLLQYNTYSPRLSPAGKIFKRKVCKSCKYYLYKKFDHTHQLLITLIDRNISSCISIRISVHVRERSALGRTAK